MNRRRNFIKILVGGVLAFMVIGFNNCGKTLSVFGTDTGNPGSPGPGSEEIPSVICQKLESCFSPVLLNCENKMLAVTNLDSALGLPANQYPTLLDILSAVSDSRLRENSGKKENCFQQIKAVDCLGALVQSSYSPSSIEDLSNVFKLLSVDADCGSYLSP